MGYIPPNAKWYLADLVVEFRIEDELDNIVHYNLTLVRADSPEEAYSKALVFGSNHNSTYKNPDGKQVHAIFRGLRNLLVIYDALEDGAEILESYLSRKRDVTATKAFFRKALKHHGEPRSITLDGFEPSHAALRRMGMGNDSTFAGPIL